MGVEKHRFLGLGVIIPFVEGLEINGAEFPLLEGIGFSPLKAPELLKSTHREPVIHQLDSTVGNHSFERRALAEELEVVRGGAKFHDPLDAGSIVPGAVKEDHFSLGWQVFDIALKIPLAHLAFGWFFERDNVGGAWV